MQAGLDAFRESTTTALVAAHAQELREPQVRDNVLIRAHLRNKQKSQRAEMLESFHAADTKLSKMLTRAGDQELAVQNGAVIDDMYSLLAEQETRVRTILGNDCTTSSTPAAQFEDRLATTAVKPKEALTDTSVDPEDDGVYVHASRARLVANDMWLTQYRKICVTNGFLKSVQPDRAVEDKNGVSVNMEESVVQHSSIDGTSFVQHQRPTTRVEGNGSSKTRAPRPPPRPSCSTSRSTKHLQLKVAGVVTAAIGTGNHQNP